MSQNITKRIHKCYRQCHRMSQKGVKSLIDSVFVDKDRFLNASGKKRVEWQGRVLFFYFILSYLFGVGTAIFSDLEPCGIFYTYANTIQGSCIVFVLLLYFKKIISIRRAITFAFSICTVEIIVEMFHQAMYDGERGPFSIMTNMVILICIASYPHWLMSESCHYAYRWHPLSPTIYAPTWPIARKWRIMPICWHWHLYASPSWGHIWQERLRY